MARSEDAAARGQRLRELMETADPQPAIVSEQKDPPGSRWDHIPAQQVLVVEHDGKVMGAVTVDTEEGRLLFSQEDSPCPTCGQEWKRGTRLEGETKVIWPDHYKS